MDHSEAKKIETLVRKLQQHEEIIMQLLKIIAATNCKVDEYIDQSSNKKTSHLH